MVLPDYPPTTSPGNSRQTMSLAPQRRTKWDARREAARNVDRGPGDDLALRRNSRSSIAWRRKRANAAACAAADSSIARGRATGSAVRAGNTAVAMADEGAPFRHPIDWRNPEFYDGEALERETRRVFDICHGCRRCFSLCDSFPRLFDLIDESETGELDSVDSSGFKSVVDACTLCDMCFMTMCPLHPAARVGRRFSPSHAAPPRRRSPRWTTPYHGIQTACGRPTETAALPAPSRRS